MAKAILIVPTGRGVGLTTVALGFVHALDRQGLPVGFCKPITQLHATDTGPERSTRLVQKIASLHPPEPLTRSEVEALLGHGDENQLLEEVVARYEQAARGMSVVIVEGLVTTDQQPYATRINTKIAQSLDADIIIVAAPGNRTPAALAEAVEIAARPYGGVGDERMIGCVLNLVNAPVDQNGHLRFDVGSDGDEEGGYREEDLRRECGRLWPETFKLLGCIPWRRALIAPRVMDVIRATNAEVLNQGQFDRRITHATLAARNLAHCCASFRPGALIITPGDRDDVVIAACMAALGGTRIAALLLTGGLKPSSDIMELCRPGLETGLPVLAVPIDGMQAVLNIPLMNLEVPLDDQDRIERVVQAAASHLDTEWKDGLLARSEERRLSPAAFRYQLIEHAHRANKRIVLPEGNEPRTLEAATICQQRGIARCVLLGNPDRIRRVAGRYSVQLPEEIEIINPTQVVQRYIEPMVALRAHKGLTPQLAEEQLQDNVVLGTMMLQLGEVDGLVSGAVHTTANTIRPALQLIKTAPGARLISSIFFMCLPEQVLVYGDCAVNPDPDAEDLADIAIVSADSARAFGITPRVAMLSYSTGTSGSGSDVEKVREATRIARERRPDLLIDGPLQYDAAAIEDVGEAKAPGSRVAGHATVFVFPDLNTGNTTYKAVQRSAHVISIGPMLQGLRKPVNDLSRGALVEDIVFTIALTAIQAEQAEERAHKELQ